MLTPVFDNFAASLRDLVAPARCHWCAARTPGPPACNACAASLPWNDCACRACALPLVPGTEPCGSRVCGECLASSPPQDRTWAAFTYDEPVAGQIVSLKFHGRLASGHVLGALLAGRLAGRPEPLPELLIPVPLHAARLRRRGYNQALELAREISRRLSIPLAAGAARRVRSTGEQSRLDAVARRRNVRAAFEVDTIVRGRHVALLDDVITTGATVAELSRAARTAGASRIEVWAAARVP
jgi:ComF family protein